MSKNGILYRGTSYKLQITATDQNGAIVNWDDITNYKLTIYSDITKTVLKEFDKSDLTIDDPATGIAYAEITGEETQAAKAELYIVEYKYKTATEEKSGKSQWGKFVGMKLEKEHFALS